MPCSREGSREHAAVELLTILAMKRGERAEKDKKERNV
jgi:hypothetical protein